MDSAYTANKAQEAESARQLQAARLAARPGADERPAAVHCWVYGPPEDPGPFPGLIV